MKRLCAIALFLLVILSLCACGNTSDSSVSDKPLTWQDQYDLGVRYLSEGNYEEAIIAFTAAIDIDPKQADTYRSLAEAYRALGRNEEANEILKKGFEITGDESLRAKSWSENLNPDEIAMVNELLDVLEKHDAEGTRDILSNETFISLIEQISFSPETETIRYAVLGLPDRGAIITLNTDYYDPFQLICIFGQWNCGMDESWDECFVYHPYGSCVYYESSSADTYLFTVADFENGLANGTCTKTEFRSTMTHDGNGWKSSTVINTMSGSTLNGLWDGLVTIRNQNTWPDGSWDITGETEFVNGVPVLLGYTQGGLACYSRNTETGKLLGPSEVGAFDYSEGTLPYPYQRASHNYDREQTPAEFAKNNMGLIVKIPYIWE